METENFMQYLARITGGMSRRKIAERIGIGTSTFTAQLAKAQESGSKVPMETAVAVGRTFDASPFPAAIAAGYITEQELEQVTNGSVALLSQLSDDALTDEVRRRLRLRSMADAPTLGG
ncbi:hypothetical protein [Glutamicibacter creatinolyticus]|uniref:hypothetical protein n=1 Tax=Glutamicibacter creatinolyticus TaxID=162496 RepID=UPI0031D68BD7